MTQRGAVPARRSGPLQGRSRPAPERRCHGMVNTSQLRELLATWAVHDLHHVSQIFAGMAASQDAAVGPWKTYLGILLRRDDPAAIPG